MILFKKIFFLKKTRNSPGKCAFLAQFYTQLHIITHGYTEKYNTFDLLTFSERNQSNNSLSVIHKLSVTNTYFYHKTRKMQKNFN